jgi:predicted GNAT superfamily acetyltransferase
MASNGQNGKIEIRPLTRLEEMAEVEAVQRTAWNDPTAVVYRNMLLTLSRNGGLVLGAIDEGRIVGFVMGYLGIESPDAERPAMANLKFVSQRMAVLPEYRDKGIGYEMKLAQRDYAMKQGIRLITWTYDPLQTRNAHLNIRKLGAVVREYWRDYYGTEPSPQVTLGSSDRFIAEWWVSSNRVKQRLNGNRAGLQLQQYLHGSVILNPTEAGPQGFPIPKAIVPTAQSLVVLIEVPDDFGGMVEQQPDLARAWRQHSRELFEQMFRSGYAVTDYVRGNHEERMRSFYTMSIAETPTGGFSSN